MKRTLLQERKYKKMLKHIDNCLGEQDAGMLIAIICDALDKMDTRVMRSIKLTINNYFTSGFDFETGEAIDE